MECKFNDDYCTNSTCKLSFVNRKDKTATVGCNVIKPINLVHTKVTMFYRFTSGYRKFLIDLDLEFCKFMDGSLTSAFMDVTMKVIKMYSNLDHPCPYIGNHSIVNMPLNSAIFGHQFVPAGQYLIDVNVQSNGTTVVFVKFYFDIPTGTSEDDQMG